MCKFPPVADLGSFSPASVCVGIQSLTEELFPAFIEAHILHAALKEGLGVHFGTASGESLVCGDQAARGLPSILLGQMWRARPACPTAVMPTSLISVPQCPALSQGGGAEHLSPCRRLEVVFRVTVIVSTQATHTPVKNAGDRDPQVLAPVVQHPELEVGGEHNKSATLRDSQLPVVQGGGQICLDAIHLHGREENEESYTGRLQSDAHFPESKPHRRQWGILLCRQAQECAPRELRARSKGYFINADVGVSGGALTLTLRLPDRC